MALYRSLHDQIMREAVACGRLKPKSVKPRESWYCEPCAVAVYERRCPHCGKLKDDKK